MRTLIPVFAILGAVTGAPQLTLLPYTYLADPLPVYQQSQDTRTGVHAYSYAGGPSAKEEIRGLDGVTRGSYSYLDAHGILQSVFYVADEGGFRVAATNLPSDNLLYDTDAVLLPENVLGERAKTAAKEEKGETASRRKRSPETTADPQLQLQPENPSSREDRIDPQASSTASSKSSHELPAPEENAEKGRPDRGSTIVAPVYGLVDSTLVPRLFAAVTSHENRVDVRNNIPLKTVEPVVETIATLSEPVYNAVILPGQLPLATSHQSRVQVHNNLRVEAPEKLIEDPRTRSQTPLPVTAVKYHRLQPLPLVPALANYNENRIQLHKNLGLESPARKDAVKIDAARLAIVETPIVTQQRILPIATAVSSQSRTQIHRNAKLEITVPIASEPTVYLANPYIPFANLPILKPIARSSQYRSQIHSNEKIEVIE